MKITELLNNGKNIITGIQSKNPEEIIEELLGLFPFDEKKKKEYMKGLKEREKSSSTGIGNEVAIPHVRSPKETDFKFAIGITKESVKFNDPSGCGTRIFFLTISPSEQGNLHLMLLSHISIICKDRALLEKIKAAGSGDEIYHLLLDKEASIEKIREEIAGEEGKIKKFHLLLIVLYKEEYLKDILSIFYQFGLESTSVIEGREYKSFMASHVSFFQGFRDIMSEDNTVNNIVLSIVEEEKVFRISKLIEHACSGFNEKEDGFLIATPVSFHLGML